MSQHKGFRALVAALALTAPILLAQPASAADAQVASDLVITSLSNPPAGVVRGQSFTVTDTTTNIGNATAVPTTTRYYLSLDTVRNGGDRLLVGGRPVASLTAGAGDTGSRSVKVPVNVSVGMYYVLACADDLLVDTEGNETNNCLASALRTQVTTAGAPDLVVSAVSNPPASAATGSSFSVTDTTSNVGGGTAGASTTRFYLSTDVVRNAGDRLLVGGRQVVSLAPGASETGSRSVKVPVNVVPGSYYLIACADDTLVIAEANETNNCFSSSNRVSVGAALPDLYADAASATATSVPAGGAFTAFSHTHNAGVADAPASQLRWYISFDTTFDASDRPLTGILQVPALGSGQLSTGERSVTVPRNVPSGTYYLYSCADDSSVVAESDETNNCSTAGDLITVTPATPL